jgi:allantoin racemase
LAAARELVNIPVIGPGQTGMHLAATLGYRFSILVALSSGIASMEALCARYGLRDRLASVRALGIPVLESDRNPAQLMEVLFEQSQLAIKHDRADVIILGCTCMTGLASALTGRLAKAGTPASVIDPLLVAVVQAEGLVLCGLSHSKRAFPPPAKTIVGYDFVQGLLSPQVDQHDIGDC